jgi:hypothetical protein
MMASSESLCDGGCQLDEVSFRHFAPLLRASQDYAEHSGYRFRSSSFDGLSLGDGLEADDASEFVELPNAGSEAPSSGSSGSGRLAVISEERAQDAGLRLAAKIRALPQVGDFAARLQAGEPALQEELDRAFRLVMTESVRNSMIGTCQALGVFPPMPPPAGIVMDDCAYEDASAPLPDIAQRLYNDQARRLGEGDVWGSSASSDPDGPGDASVGQRLQRRAMTAAFLVDFAEGVGVALPTMSDTQEAMLQDFAQRIEEWGAKSKAEEGAVRRAAENDPRREEREAESAGLASWAESAGLASWVPSVSPDAHAVQDAEASWRSQESTLWAATAGAVVLSAAAALWGGRQLAKSPS